LGSRVWVLPVLEQHGGVDDGEVVKLERLEIVHQPVSHQDNIGPNNPPQCRLKG